MGGSIEQGTHALCAKIYSLHSSTSALPLAHVMVWPQLPPAAERALHRAAAAGRERHYCGFRPQLLEQMRAKGVVEHGGHIAHADGRALHVLHRCSNVLDTHARARECGAPLICCARSWPWCAVRGAWFFSFKALNCSKRLAVRRATNQTRRAAACRCNSQRRRRPEDPSWCRPKQ